MSPAWIWTMTSPISATMVDYTNVLVIQRPAIKMCRNWSTHSKKNPDTGHSDRPAGGIHHLSAELLKQKTDANMLHVPYRGNSPAMMDVIGGKITFMFDIISTAKTYIDSGRVRALAVTSRERNEGLPDVPTMIEAGVKDYAVTGWYGLIGPKQLPEHVRARLESAMKTITKNPEFVKNMKQGGYTIDVYSGAALHERAKKEYALWADVIKKAGIRVD